MRGPGRHHDFAAAVPHHPNHSRFHPDGQRIPNVLGYCRCPSHPHPNALAPRHPHFRHTPNTTIHADAHSHGSPTPHPYRYPVAYPRPLRRRVHRARLGRIRASHLRVRRADRLD